MMADFDSWFARQTPAQVIAALGPLLTDERRAKIEGVLDRRLTGLTVAIENLHDPHNGAAAMRSVEGFGLGELHVVEDASRFSFSSKVTQGCEKWVGVSRYPDFSECARVLHARGFALAAAVPGGTFSVDAIDVTRPTALVFGNEHAGLTGAAQSACDVTFSIPMQGFTQSFNLSVSVAIAVYECARRRRLTGLAELSDGEKEVLRARWYALSLDARAAEGIVSRYVSGQTHPGVGDEPHGC